MDLKHGVSQTCQKTAMDTALVQSFVSFVVLILYLCYSNRFFASLMVILVYDGHDNDDKRVIMIMIMIMIMMIKA